MMMMMGKGQSEIEACADEAAVRTWSRISLLLQVVMMMKMVMVVMMKVVMVMVVVMKMVMVVMVMDDGKSAV